MIKFTAPIEPVPFKRVATHGKRRYNDPRYSAFKDALGWHALQAMDGREPLKGAVRINVIISRKRKPTSRTFGDGDNHLKAILDALNGICYEDDAQVVIGTFLKRRGEPSIEIELEEIK